MGDTAQDAEDGPAPTSASESDDDAGSSGDGDGDPEPPDDTTAVADCNASAGYTVSSWRADDPTIPQLWVAGVYETPGGKGTIEWALPGEHVLLVSAYVATDWNVELSGAGQLSRVIAIGHEWQTVDAPGVPIVEAYSYAAGDPFYECGYELPGDPQGCATEALLELGERLTGLKVSAFDGCYDASTFSYVLVD